MSSFSVALGLRLKAESWFCSSLLFTDGRYWLQAGKQLSDEWTLMKLGLPGPFGPLLLPLGFL